MLLRIKNLRVQSRLGVYDWEQHGVHKIILNIEIHFDGSAAAKSDKITDTIDYAQIEKELIDLIEGRKFHLVETLAHHVAEHILTYPKVEEVSVEVDKVGTLKHTDSVSIQQRLSKKG